MILLNYTRLPTLITGATRAWVIKLREGYMWGIFTYKTVGLGVKRSAFILRLLRLF